MVVADALSVVVPMSVWYAVSAVRGIWAVAAVTSVMAWSTVGGAVITSPVWVTDTVVVVVGMRVIDTGNTVTGIWASAPTVAFSRTVGWVHWDRTVISHPPIVTLTGT